MGNRDYPYELGDRVVSLYDGRHGAVVSIHADLCRVEYDMECGRYVYEPYSNLIAEDKYEDHLKASARLAARSA